MNTTTAAPVSAQELETFALAAANLEGAWPSVSDDFRVDMFCEFLSFYDLGYSDEFATHKWAKDAELSTLYGAIAYFVDTDPEGLDAWTYEETQRVVDAVDVVRKKIETAAPFVCAAPGTAFHLAVWAVLSGGTFPAPRS